MNSHTHKPLALDLCCGKGGWARGLIAAGWRVIGIDSEDFSKDYPGEFIQADLLQWEGWRELKPDLIVASTPCQEFTRHWLPWLKRKGPPPPNIALWNVANLIAAATGAPIVQENVKGAQKFLGRSRANCGPFHLWGDVPPIIPTFHGKNKESYGGGQAADRAIIPFHLAHHIGRCFKP